jgi:adenylosuccinate lyase
LKKKKNWCLKLNEVYTDPLVSRYTDKEMQELFSEKFKFTTWRRCWIALAKSQMELGLKQVTPEMVQEMEKAKEDIDDKVAREKEKEIRHDVMAHVYEFGTHCPKAKGIIHLGATSQFVVCNTDLIQIKKALEIIKKQLINVISNLSSFSEENKKLTCLGYTHYQPAQPTTIGKRITLYLHDLLIDLKEIENLERNIKARGAKGTTGTQATFLELFEGDYEKVKELDKKVGLELGFEEVYNVTGQTYSRKIDSLIAKVLSGIGEGAHKFAVDLRLLSNLKVMEEPFAKNQTGSSAMAYKRNPMRSERMTGLCRKLMSLPVNFSHTYANQWFERTLDDSAIRRIDVAQTFLLTNAVLKLYQNITKGLVVNKAQVEKHLDQELPFMATEKMLMELSKKGHDRQEMHELIKIHSIAAGNVVKQEGKDNDLLQRLASDEKFPMDEKELQELIKNKEVFAGASRMQTEEFLEKEVKPILEKYKDFIGETDSTINV